MKKLASILITTAFFANVSIADTTETSATAPVATATGEGLAVIDSKENESIQVNQYFKISPETRHEEDQQFSYTIDTKIPQIYADNLTAPAQEFNRLINESVKQSIQQFKNYVKADMPHMQTLPDAIKHNSLRIDYDIDVVKPENQTIVSVRLSIEGMQAGRAHPYHMHKVFNFDLSKGKLLTLNDIFKPGTKYLTLFAKYSNKSLNEKLHDKWMIAAGTAPTLKNYAHWNLEDDGILITFDEYQVAPYVDGPQEVEIPYTELRPLILSKAPIVGCVINSESCAMLS
ncbi:MAG: DUF3298 domain-containing protein [Gammaproteobacteria bacterium]